MVSKHVFSSPYVNRAHFEVVAVSRQRVSWSTRQTLYHHQVGAGIKLLNITRLTMPRRDAHPGPGGEKGHGMDCTHFCLPGIPDDWNLMFLASLPEWMAEHGREATKL